MTVSRRALVHALILALVACSATAASAHQPPDWIAATIADRAEAHGVSAAWLIAVADCEMGHGWNLHAVGRAGELGPFQLHPQGELRGFYARGYSDPFDLWESADYAATRFSEGAARAWSCA